MSEQKKLIIEVDNGEKDTGIIIRISRKSNALLDDIAKRSGRSKSYVASRMIEYAYDFVELVGGEEDIKS